MYQLFGTSLCVSTFTTPLTASAARRVHVDQLRVVALGAVHLQMQQPLRDRVLEVLRAAGDVAERVEALDGVADDVESVAHAFAAVRIALMIDS